VESLVLDGNRSANEEINGNYAGGLFIQNCDRHTYLNVVSRSYNGDGFSFQVCDDIRFENCESMCNANLGFHPGSGSQRPEIVQCVARENSQGVFFCWGVSDGLVRECRPTDNADFGVSIGHRDTDNQIIGCIIEDNRRCGILFRDEGEGFLAGHRNTIAQCVIRDNGGSENGRGIDMRKEPCNVVIRNNSFEDSGSGQQKIGLRIDRGVRQESVDGNRFSGMAETIRDDRSSES